jgi:hypothetical protein
MSPIPKASLLIAIMLEAACAWTQIPLSKRQKITTPWRSCTFAARPTDEGSSFAVPEEECYDLCEIDWDIMPSAEEEDDEQEVADDEHLESFQRMRLELQWGMRENQEDCDLEDIDTCGEFCHECTGLGWVPCHFCRGSTRLNVGENVLGPTSVKCPICKTGAISCQKCRGTGRIAPWTTIANSTIT